MEHLGKRDLPDFRVIRLTVSRAGRQILQEFDIVLALFFEMIEGVFGVGISIEIEIPPTAVACSIMTREGFYFMYLLPRNLRERWWRLLLMRSILRMR